MLNLPALSVILPRLVFWMETDTAEIGTFPDFAIPDTEPVWALTREAESNKMKEKQNEPSLNKFISIITLIILLYKCSKLD